MNYWNSLPSSKQQMLTNLQLAQEEQWKQEMLAKYRRSIEQGTDLPEALQSVVDEHAIWFKEFISVYIENAQSKKARLPEWAHYLLTLGYDSLAYIVIDSVITSSFHAAYRKSEQEHDWPLPQAQYVAKLIGDRFWTLAAWLKSKDVAMDFYRHQTKFFKNWDKRRRNAFIKKVAAMADATPKQKADFGHAMLRLAEASELIQLHEHKERPTSRLKKLKSTLFVGLNPELLQYIVTRVEEYAQRLDPNHLPMLCKPVPYTDTEMGGFMDWTIRGKQRVRNEEATSDVDIFSPVTLTVINALQDSEWRINTRVLDVMQHFWDNSLAIGAAPCSDAVEIKEMRPFPEGDDKQAIALWMEEKSEAWNAWYRNMNSRLQHSLRLREANKIKKFVVWHAYFVDFRGRFYSDSYLMHPQGGDLDKALIYAAQPVDCPNPYWVKVNLANLYGVDKCSFDERVAWVDANMEMFKAINEDPIGTRADWEDDAPKKNTSFQRLAAIFDLIEVVYGSGQTRVPVQIDGACNGVQHWAALTRDKIVGEQVNLTPSDKPQDVYQVVADRCTELCMGTIDDHGWHEKFLSQWAGTIPRKATKRAVMCDPYGISKFRVEYYIDAEGHMNWIPEKKMRRYAAKRLANLIEQAKLEVMAHCNHGKQFVTLLTGWVADEIDKPISFVTPSGFTFINHYNKVAEQRSRVRIWNKGFTLTDLTDLRFGMYTDEFDHDKAASGMPPNFVHALDAAHMSLVILRMAQMGIEFFSMIHDSYGVLAPYVTMLRDVTKETFYDIHSQDQLKLLLQRAEELVGKPLPEKHPAWQHYLERGSLDIRGVLDSEYLFG